MPVTVYTWKFNGSTTGPAPPGGGNVYVGNNTYEINGDFSARAPHDFPVTIESSPGTYVPSLPDDSTSDSLYLRGTFVYAQPLDQGRINLLGVTTRVTVTDLLDKTTSAYTQECSIIVGIRPKPAV